MKDQIFEEVVIRLTQEERKALVKFGEKMGANLSDVIRGFVTYTTQLEDFPERIEKVASIVNTFAITRKLEEQENNAKLR